MRILVCASLVWAVWGAGVIACTETPPPKSPEESASDVVDSVGSVSPSHSPKGGVDEPYPDPAEYTEFETDECKAAVVALRAGLALESQVWLATTCFVDAMIKSGRAVDVQPFVDRVTEFQTKTTHFLVVDVDAAERAGVAVPKAEDPTVVLYASPEAREKFGPKETATLGTGSFRGVCLPWQRKPGVGGHYEVTKSALDTLRNRSEGQRYSFTRAAENIMADASQDPDFFAWTDMAAHGQTPDINGMPADADAKAGWLAWVATGMKRAGEYCAKLDLESQINGVYFLGYTLHSVQDVAPHRGRTNPEHAYNARQGRNPDQEEGIDKLATEMAAAALSSALQGKAKACVSVLSSLKRGNILFHQKMSRFDFQWTGTPLALWTYEKSYVDFEPHVEKKDAYVRWFGTTDAWDQSVACSQEDGCKELLRQLHDVLQ